MFIVKKNLNDINLKSIAVLCIIFILGLWCLPANAAAFVLINDAISGEQRVPGYPLPNDDGSTVLLGTTNIGDAVGDLPGRWAVIMHTTYLEGETSGDVVGFFAVGENGQDAVYGIIAGITDPTDGTFSFMATVVDGIGIYEGHTGFGTFFGDLIDEGQFIEGSLSLVLKKTETAIFRKERSNRGRVNPALVLLGN